MGVPSDVAGLKRICRAISSAFASRSADPEDSRMETVSIDASAAMQTFTHAVTLFSPAAG